MDKLKQYILKERTNAKNRMEELKDEENAQTGNLLDLMRCMVYDEILQQIDDIEKGE